MLDVAEVYVRVWDFFGKNFEKTRLWFDLDNPMLGISPRRMIEHGRVEMLLAWVKQQIEEGQSLGSPE